MHVPDGFIDVPVSAVAGVAAVAAVGVSLRGARRELADERAAPLAGLVAAFVFAVQMLNFPVAAGTSGHLLGGALAAILVGPFTGVLCISVVLLMQGVLFADGGLTALGVNITVMGVVTVLVSYGIFRGLVKVLPRGRRRSVTVAAFVAALVSVPAAAAFFTLVYALGGTTDVPVGKVLTAMVGVHVLIGIGEAVITALTVSAVLAVRPDLVHGARGLAAPLKLRVGGQLVDAPAPDRPAVPEASELAAASDLSAATELSAATDTAAVPVAARSARKFWGVGLLTAVVLAGVVSLYASSDPDGLEKVAADQGIDAQAKDREHATAESPLAEYQVKLIGDTPLSNGLAGVIGVGVTVAVGSGVFWAVRRRRTTDSAAPSAAESAAPSAAEPTPRADA